MIIVMRNVLCMFLAVAVLFGLTGCSAGGNATDLMDHVKAKKTEVRAIDESFAASQMELSTALFQASVSKEPRNNCLISPLSVQLVLAMTANGAAGETKEEMLRILGGQISLELLNEYLHGYVEGLESGKDFDLRIANSIWFREDGQLAVKDSFLQTNADYYGAQVFKSAFNGKTANDINSWVKEHTGGMIDSIVDAMDPNTVMFLINALAFDAQWQCPYEGTDMHEGTFTTEAGEIQKADMMITTEQLYLEGKNVTGFIKPYKGGRYSFAAFLPDEGIGLDEYISRLDGGELREILDNAKSGTVLTTLPKFSYEHTVEMNDILIALGIDDAFDSELADFTGIGTLQGQNIYMDQVLHKTFISVDALGTKAGAATKVEVGTKGALEYQWSVNLNRPFMYMIVDNEADLPIFIGTVADIAR